MQFNEYYKLNEILDMTKRCDGLKVLSDDIVDGNNMISVDIGRDIILKIATRTSRNSKIVNIDFNKRGSDVYLPSEEGDEIGNIGRVFDALYCALKGKNFDPNEIQYAITAGDKDVLIPINPSWYDDAFKMLTSYNFSDPIILDKIKASNPITMKDRSDIVAYLQKFNDYSDKAIYNPIMNISRNFNVKNLRSEYYRKIIDKNFPGIKTTHKILGLSHSIVLNGSFING